MKELDVLNQKMTTCTACGLSAGRTRVVPSEGSDTPRFMVLGEAPGEDEDLTGHPFCGKAGQKLDKIFAFLGVKREDVYVANSVQCRPPGNRLPAKNELDACRWRLEHEIILVRPPLIVLLGRTALDQLNGKPSKGVLRDKFPDRAGWGNHKIGDFETKTAVVYHPSYMLRSPEKSYNESLASWKKIKEWLEQEKKMRKSSIHD